MAVKYTNKAQKEYLEKHGLLGTSSPGTGQQDTGGIEYVNEEQRKYLARQGYGTYNDQERADLAAWQQIAADANGLYSRASRQLNRDGWRNYQNDAQFKNAIDEKVKSVEDYLKGINQSNVTYKQAKEYLRALQQMQQGYQYRSDYYGQYASENDYKLKQKVMDQAIAQLQNTDWAGYQGDRSYEDRINDLRRSATEHLQNLDPKSPYYQQAKNYVAQLGDLQGAYQSREDFYGQFADEKDFTRTTGLYEDLNKYVNDGGSYEDYYSQSQDSASAATKQYEDATRQREHIEQMLGDLRAYIYYPEQYAQEWVNKGRPALNTPQEREQYQQYLEQQLELARGEERMYQDRANEANIKSTFAKYSMYSNYTTREDFQEGVEAGKAAKEAYVSPIYTPNVFADNPMAIAFSDYISRKNDSHVDFDEIKPRDDWTEDEANIFYYLYNQNPEEAAEYAWETNDRKNAAKFGQQQKGWEEWTNKNGWNRAAGWGANLFSAPFQTADYLAKGIEYGVTGQVMTHGDMTPADVSNTMMAAARDYLNDVAALPEYVPVIGGKGLGDVYALTNSIAKSMMMAKLGGGAVNALFFGDAANNGFDEAKRRGATDGQALVFGALSGAAEVIGETISIERLVHMNNPGTFKSWLKETLKQGGVEASEEAFTTMLNTLSDAYVMADKSELNQTIQAYMSQGMSKEEAEKKAWLEWFNGLAYDALGGFLSGGVSGGLQQGFNMSRASKTEYSGFDRSELLDLALQQPEGSSANKLAQKIQSQGTMSAQEATRLRGLMPGEAERLDRQTRSDLERQVRSRLGENSQVSEKDIRSIVEELTTWEPKTYGSREAQQVAQEMKRERMIVDNIRYRNAQKSRQAVEIKQKASDNLKRAFTAINLEISDNDLDTLASEYIGKKDLNTFTLAMRDAYRLGKSGMSFQQAVENSTNSKKVEPINFQHAWELGYRAGGRTVEESKTAGTHVDTSTEEGLKEVTAKLSMFGDDAAAVAALYNQGQDVDTYVDRMNRAANVYAAAGMDVASVAKDANLLGLTAEQMKKAQELGAKIRQERENESAQARRTAIDIRQRMQELLKGDITANEMESLQQQLDEADHFARQIRKDIRQQEDAIQKMEDGKGRQQAEKELAKAQDALAKLNQAMRDISRNQRQLEGKRTIQRKNGTISFDGAKLSDGTVLNAADRNDLSRAQKKVVAMVTALADAINIDYVFFNNPADAEGRNIGGMYVKGGTIYINLNEATADKIAAATLGHELTHYIQEYAPTEYQELKDFVLKHLQAKDLAEFDRLLRQQASWEPGKKLGEIEDELVANACQEMLLNEKVITQLARENMRLAERLQDIIANLKEKILKAFENVKFARQGTPLDAAKSMRDAFDEMAEIWARGISRANETYNAAQAIGEEAVREIAKANATQVGSYDLENFTEAKTEDGEELFQIYAFENDEDQYRTMLEKWGGMSSTEIDELFNTVDAAMAKIMKNLEALDYAWEEDINDRGFQAIKQNSDKLYKVSLDFSTLCRKRLLQGLIAGQLSAALQRGLSKEEGIAVRDALLAIQAEGKQIEVACALCYVESARMRSQKAIQEFLEDREGALRNYYANQRGREAVAKAEMEERQAIYDELVKADKEAGKPMSEWGLVRGKGDDATMYDIRDSKKAKMSKIPTAMKKRIQDAKKAARKGYALTAEQQATVDYANSLPVEAFTTPEGLQELAKSKYRDIFNAFVLKVSAASKSKGIENDTWWRAGDSQAVGDALIRQMNAENGLRTQSWSDFTVKHLMDYIAATIELSTRGAKQHAYTKVLDYVDLMGRTGLMINMSLIPTRDYKGKLEYDPVEGINYDGAMKMREKFPDTAGTICIGITVDQIHQLLDSMDIDYVIPYHASGMSKDTRKLMHIPAWENFQDYQSEKKLSGSAARENARKYGVELLSESDPLWHEGPSFSEWFDLEKARATAKRVGKTGKYGVMTGGYAAMQEAAENYKRICAQRGLAPKFSYGSAAFDADFSNDAGYWKLLIDRKMVNNKTGEIIEQRALKPTFDFETVQRILDDELKRYPGVKADQENAILRVTRSFLKGDVKAGMSSEEIAKVMQTPVDNVPITNITQNAQQLQVYDNKAQVVQSKALEDNEPDVAETNIQYSKWAGEPPKKTQYGFKLMTVTKVGDRWLPTAMFIDRANPYEFGEWYKADSPKLENLVHLEPGYSYLIDENDNADMATRRPFKKTSRLNKKGQKQTSYSQLPSVSEIDQATRDGKRWMLVDRYADGGVNIQNLGVNGSGTVSKFALRPGIHAVDIPSMAHIGAVDKENGGKKRRTNERWFLIEYPVDVDYNQEAYSHESKDIRDHLPTGGWYSYQTNSGAEARQHWFITGGMKIVGAVSEADVRKYAKDRGFEQDLQWRDGKVYSEDDAIDMEEYLRTTTAQPTPSKDEMRRRIEGGVQMQTWEEAEKRYGIKSVNDYVGVQKAVISTLDKEGFFDGVHNVVTMDDGGMVIEITKDGIRETLGPGDRYNTLPSELKKAKIATIDQLPQVIKQAKLTEDNAKNVKNPRSGVKYAYLQGEGEYEDATREIDVTVRKSPQKNKFWIHNVQLTQKKDNEPGLSTSEGNPQRAYIKAQARKDIVPESAEKSKTQSQTWSEGEVYNGRAVVSEETIDKWLSGSWFGSNHDKNYAQAYIAYMRPQQYLRLSTIYDEPRIRAESADRTMEWAKDVSKSQPIQLKIDTENAKVWDHEGRHRMVVLERAGVRQVPVLLFDLSNKYSKEPIAEIRLQGQDFNGMTNYASSTVSDLVPLNQAHREEIIQKFSKKTSLEKMSEKYDGYKTLQFQKWDQDHNDWAPTFYSKMDRVVSDWTNGKGQKLPPKMAANQVVGWLRGKGVKAEEIRWSGIVPWLEGRKTVTQQELQAVMAGNEVKIETKVLGAATGRKKSNATSARWGFYNLPGGVNYREILFKIPDLAFTNGAMQMHWGVGESGIVSHTRVQDFPGFYSYTLYAEEIQSDLHNAGAANGFSESGVPDVPFAGSAGTYYEYVMKQLLRLAAEHGYTTIAWPTADILSKRFGDKYREAYRIEYDQNIPKFMNKYVKQWGAKVAKTTLENNGAEVWSVELTDAMRESVLHEGQPLFQKWTENDDTESEKRGREQAATRLQAENAALSQTVKELKALSRKQKGSIEKLQKMMQLTRTPETRLYDARQMARQLKADYSATAETEALATQLKALGDTLLQTDTAELNEQALKDQARSIARAIVESASETAADPQVENTAGAEELTVNPYQVHADEAIESIANRILTETMEGTLRPVPPTKADKAKDQVDALRQQILSLKRENALSEKEAGRLYQTVYDLSLALDKAQSRARTLRESARYREAQIHEEGLARAAEVKARERARSEKLLQAQKDYYRELAERYRDRRNESAGASKYRKQVEQRAGQLYEMLMTNSDKLHVPEVLKGPLADFLESIDFSSKRALAGGPETRKDRDFGARLLRVQQMLENQQRYIDGDGSVQQDLGGYLDIGQDSMTFLRQSAEMITQAMQMSRGFTVNQMSADQLKDLAKFLQNLRAAIRNMNEFMANERFASVREAADGDVTEMEAMGRAPELAENRMLNDILWKNGTPYYIMKRFGEGGKSIFEGFTKGWAQMAFDAREIIDFTEKAYTDKEVKEWKNQKHEITLEDGSKVTMTTAQIMELSQLLGREQARKHIFKGGMRIGNIETKRGAKGDTTHYHLTDADIQTILGKLTDRQQKVAKELQRFMADKGAEWGNEVSMKRFGYKFYEEGPGYYPIRTDANDRPMADTDAQTNSMFRLLNLSSSKSLNPRASNALIVGDIFETFASHMGDMAKLHGMGLPVLDAIKWFNYKERIEKGDGQYSTRTMQGAMEQAFGSAALSYFRTLMKDINGVTENSDRGTTFYSKAMGRFKAAAVGANLRVALLQPTAYVRAAKVLKPQYMLAAFGNLHASVFSAAGAKAAWKEAMKHSGEMIWKDIGGYDTDLARTMRGQIQHDDSFMDKLVEATMLGAEWGDKLTWGRLWAACKLQAKAENKGLSGEELMQKTEDLFREVIYSSQVMDSTLTRSELMRSSSVGSKMITPFMAEPTVSFNILMDAASDLRNDTRKYGRAEAWQRNAKKIGKAFAVYCMSAAAAALAESLWDAVRDDDDEEYWKKFLAALFGEENAARIWGDELDEKEKGIAASAWSGNLVQDLSILGKLPVVKDVISLLSGYSSTNMATDAFKNIINAYQIWRETIELANGTLEKPTKTTSYGKMTQWGKIYKSLQGLSQLTGLPMYGLTRDVTAIWNTVMNGRKDEWKIRTYDGNQLSQSKINTYKEIVAPTSVSQKDYQRMLTEMNTNGNSSISQDEAGPYLLAAEKAGSLTHQQAAAIWSAATTGKTTYDEWIAKQQK